MDVRILGKTYSLRNDQDSNLIQDAAVLIDKIANDLYTKMGPIPIERVSILIAMNLAGDLLQLRKTMEEKNLKLSAKIDSILEKIESSHSTTSN